MPIFELGVTNEQRRDNYARQRTADNLLDLRGDIDTLHFDCSRKLSWLESRRYSTTRKKKFLPPAQVAENFFAARIESYLEG